MTNLTKKADSDNDSILDGIDCLSDTTVRTPEMSASIISVIGEQQDINADDDIVIGYLRTIIGYRSSIHSYQQQNFLKAYTAIMSGEVIRIPNRTYRSFSVESLEVRVKHHNSKLKDIVQGVGVVCCILDDIIQAYIGVLSHEAKLSAIREHRLYFHEVLDSGYITFDSLKFAQYPASYLEDFIPWVVCDKDLQLSNCRSYLATHGSPLVRYVLENHIAGTEDWDSAKTALVKEFTPKASQEEVAKSKSKVAAMMTWADINEYLESTYCNTWHKGSTYSSPCRIYDSLFSHKRVDNVTYIATYCCMSFVSAITNHSQQEFIVSALKKKSIKCISTFNFGTL
ncbi:hypothetical protein DL89DRAFT_183767 [Linderina pennispora]|uniref:Uncharacterized protein n=1 Tax=Linderina pennispora TaxID=61395 RepID=A0A1Y1W5F9_9FUNG|nr:uncharacterized protein DL89DRAFT_183767 [Linderina pennispora]ORX68769.1 hypothetical protein DL89DRAFT_183767 [Linderina pennispora]